MASRKTKASKEMDQIEKLEQEHMKRMSFTKKETKDMKRRAKEEMIGKDDDELRGIENMLESGRGEKNDEE